MLFCLFVAQHWKGRCQKRTRVLIIMSFLWKEALSSVFHWLCAELDNLLSNTKQFWALRKTAHLHLNTQEMSFKENSTPHLHLNTQELSGYICIVIHLHLIEVRCVALNWLDFPQWSPPAICNPSLSTTQWLQHDQGLSRLEEWLGLDTSTSNRHHLFLASTATTSRLRSVNRRF